MLSGRATTAPCWGEEGSQEEKLQLAGSTDGGWVYTRLKANRWRKKYVSLDLVRSYWANLGGCREIGDARAPNDLLDDRARHYRIDPRRCRYAHVFAPEKRPVSSRRPHFLHPGRDPGS